MAFKQGFQLLNAFSFRFKDKFMLTRRQSHQILRAIIRFDTIKVMNYPSFWQWLIMGLLPDKNVLKNITPNRCSRMPSSAYVNVTLPIGNPATFPRWMMPGLSITHSLMQTLPTSLAPFWQLLATINTKLRRILLMSSPLNAIQRLHTTRPTSQGSFRTGFATISTSSSQCTNHRASLSQDGHQSKDVLGIVWGFLLGAFLAWGLRLL